MRRGTAIFCGAVMLALGVGHLLRDTPGYVVLQPDGTYAGDINHYVYWTRLVTLGGIQAAYSGTWPETYAVYPPVTLYPYEAVGTLYRALEDPNFDPARAQHSLWLHEAIKFVALAWHLLVGTAIFLLLRRRTPLLAGVAAAAYLLNPAALYDVAHWAQPDGAHALFSVLGVGLLDLGLVGWAWAAIALAALAKPQAWSILPLLGLATLRHALVQRRPVWLVQAAASAATVALVVVLPFIVSGHLADLLGLPNAIASVMPVVAADAHNLWWLVLEPRGTEPIYLFDSERFIGPLTYRLAAGVLVGGSLLLAIWLHLSRRASLAEAAALSVLGWFVFTTQAHENHLFFALPLLALAWPSRRSLLGVYAVLSLSVLGNMVLHDQLVLQALGHTPDDALVVRLQLANAAANVVCYLAWAIGAALRQPMPLPDASGATGRQPALAEQRLVSSVRS
jgi:hypothetical protein